MPVKVESTGYRGEYPTGVYWSPGEVRELSPAAAIALPVGLAVVEPPKVRGKSDDAPGKNK